MNKFFKILIGLLFLPIIVFLMVLVFVIYEIIICDIFMVFIKDIQKFALYSYDLIVSLFETKKIKKLKKKEEVFK